MTIENALKACPFCKSTRIKSFSRHIDAGVFEEFGQCLDCRAKGPPSCEGGPISWDVLWNTRASGWEDRARDLEQVLGEVRARFGLNADTRALIDAVLAKSLPSLPGEGVE